jgi:hypothetical protein
MKSRKRTNQTSHQNIHWCALQSDRRLHNVLAYTLVQTDLTLIASEKIGDVCHGAGDNSNAVAFTGAGLQELGLLNSLVQQLIGDDIDSYAHTYVRTSDIESIENELLSNGSYVVHARSEGGMSTPATARTLLFSLTKEARIEHLAPRDRFRATLHSFFRQRWAFGSHNFDRSTLFV